MKFLMISLCMLLFACNNTANQTPDTTVDNSAKFAEGKTIFLGKCSSCHMVNKDMTGPALRGVESRWPDKKKLYAFIRNSEAIIKTDAYAHNLWLQYNQTMMNKHPDLSDVQIQQVLDYIKSVSISQ